MEFPERKVYLETKLSLELRLEDIKFLTDNMDYFAWSHLDIKCIPLEVAIHMQSLDPDFSSAK